MTGAEVAVRIARVALCAACTLVAACGGAESSGARGPVLGASEKPSSDAVAFAFPLLGSNGQLSSAATRGRVAVLAFVTIDNLLCQAQVRYLQEMAKHDGQQVTYALVLMESKDRRELAELYRQDLQVTFPVAMADDESLAGSGPFGTFEGYPTVVVLDREGRVTRKALGLAKPNELRDAMK
jgi:hypothetical protein